MNEEHTFQKHIFVLPRALTVRTMTDLEFQGQGESNFFLRLEGVFFFLFPFLSSFTGVGRGGQRTNNT